MNKDLFLEGKEYISASRAAQKFGYAQDYIGALVRTKKVPGKMIGRSWYVELESLLAHRNKKRVRSKQEIKIPEALPVEVRVEAVQEKIEVAAPIVFEKPLEIVVPQAVTPQEFKPLFVYESETKPRLPELSKSKYRQVAPNHFLRNLVVGTVSIMIFVSTLSSWTQFAAPEFVATFEVGVASVAEVFAPLTATAATIGRVENHAGAWIGGRATGATAFLSSFMTHARTLIARLFGEPNSTPVVVATTDRGVVVMPDSGDHVARVSEMKRTFSDDVEVTFDEEGDSGIVSPVFHSGDDTKDYAFVLVPIKQTK